MRDQITKQHFIDAVNREDWAGRHENAGLFMAAAEQREQLDRIMASSTPTGGKEFLAGWKKGYAEGIQQSATLKAQLELIAADNLDVCEQIATLEGLIAKVREYIGDGPRATHSHVGLDILAMLEPTKKTKTP